MGCSCDGVRLFLLYSNLPRRLGVEERLNQIFHAPVRSAPSVGSYPSPISDRDCRTDVCSSRSQYLGLLYQTSRVFQGIRFPRQHGEHDGSWNAAVCDLSWLDTCWNQWLTVAASGKVRLLGPKLDSLPPLHPKRCRTQSLHRTGERPHR